MKKQTLSVVLATFNEEKNITDCLESIKDLAEEIVVVDGSSADKTVEIAKKYNAKILVTSNPPIFHINKQKAIDIASKDWVLQLDADERVTPELKNEIKKAIEIGGTNGYWIPRKNWFLGRFLMKGGQYPDYTLRLYRNGKGRLPQLDVHEQAVVEGKVEYLISPLIHMADPNFKRYIQRYNRYTGLLAKELEEKKLKINFFTVLKYIVIMPTWWFILAYGRHKGFMDGWQGFTFAYFSALRFPISFIKFVRNKRK